MRKAFVYIHGMFAGTLTEDDDGYTFAYDDAYLSNTNTEAISLTLPLSTKPFASKTMLPFFDGLIPEGWLLDVAQENWKINPRDRMGLLLACCRDCIGAVSILDEKAHYG